MPAPSSTRRGTSWSWPRAAPTGLFGWVHANLFSSWLSGAVTLILVFLIARALLGEPELLLMDEPTSGVDVRLRHEVLHLLDDLNALGLAIVLTTHDLNGIAAHLPRVVCLNRRVIGDGSPQEVLTPDVLERTYGASMQVLEHGGMPVVVDSFRRAHAPHVLESHR